MGLGIGMGRVGLGRGGTGMQRGVTGMQERRIRNKEGRRRHLPPVTLSRGHPIDIREDRLPHNTRHFNFLLPIKSRYTVNILQ